MPIIVSVFANDAEVSCAELKAAPISQIPMLATARFMDSPMLRLEERRHRIQHKGIKNTKKIRPECTIMAPCPMKETRMPLKDVELEIDSAPLPPEVRLLLREAERRIEIFQRHSPVPGFVPSDFGTVFRVLRSLSSAFIAPGTLFCEWGSGFGVVACLAAMLDYAAYGIEIEVDLIHAARLLAGDFALPVEFIHGSFIPAAARARMSRKSRYAWLHATECDGEGEPGLAVDDFSVIFAYPWPDEEEFTAHLFNNYADLGAVLVTYHGGEKFRVRRKIAGGSRTR
jgi:hypothetical protein